MHRAFCSIHGITRLSIQSTIITSDHAVTNHLYNQPGFVSSGPVVLALDLAIKSGPFYNQEQLEELFKWVAGVTFIGLVSAWLLVITNRKVLTQHQIHRVEIKMPSSSRSVFGTAKESFSKKLVRGCCNAVGLPRCILYQSPTSTASQHSM